MKKIKILQINSVFGYGSTGAICAEIEEALDGSEFEFYMAYSTQTSRLPRRGYMFGSRVGKKLHALASRLTGLQGYFSKSSMSQLINFIKRVNPDVVHLHNLHSNDVNLPMLFEYLAVEKKKVVMSLHDCWFYTGKCTHYHDANCEKWMNSCGNCPKLMDDNPSWLFDRTEKSLEDKKEWYGRLAELNVISVSNWMFGEAEKSILSNAKSHKRIYNWVDEEIFKPQTRNKDYFSALGFADQDFIIVSVASAWNEAKGLKKILAIASNLPNGMRYLLIGRLPSKTVLPNSMVHVHQIENVGNLAMAYAGSNVLLNASATESFGKVTIEAMSSGIPVIGFDSTATSELIEPGTGYLFNELNSQNVQEKLEDIRNNGRNFYEKNCRHSAVERFGKLKTLQIYSCYYKNLMK